MRLIDADAFEDYIFGEWKKNEISNGDWIQFREWLKDQETVVEFEGDINKVIVKGEEYHRIVRCKDCKHRQEDTIFKKLYCDGREVVADWYCGDAERRSE